MSADYRGRRFPVVAASFRLYLLNWSRSRASLGILGFVGVLCLYDALAPNRSPSPWALLTFAGAWSGVLAAYDTYDRFRSDGSLRLILLHGHSRGAFAVGMAGGGIIVSMLGTGVAVAYLIGAGRLSELAPLLVVMPITLLAVSGWVVYSQLLSLLVPRDTAAILGIIALIFGSGPPERWVPAGTPEWLQQLIVLAWSSIPTIVRFTHALNGDHLLLNLAIETVQVTAALVVIGLLLKRGRLLARQRVEG